MSETPLTCPNCHGAAIKCLNPHSAIYMCNACACQWCETYRKPDELPRLQALALEAGRITMAKQSERIEELEAWNNTLRSDMAGLAAQAQAWRVERDRLTATLAEIEREGKAEFIAAIELRTQLAKALVEVALLRPVCDAAVAWERDRVYEGTMQMCEVDLSIAVSAYAAAKKSEAPNAN